SAGVTTGTTLDPTCSWLHRTGSANGVSARLHQTLFQGSAVPPFPGAPLRGKTPRPRNPSVPPRRRFKTLGSRPKAVPVREWLGGRAAAGPSVKSIPSRSSKSPEHMPRANPSEGVGDGGVSTPCGLAGPRWSWRRVGARPIRAPVRPLAPRHAPAVRFLVGRVGRGRTPRPTPPTTAGQLREKRAPPKAPPLRRRRGAPPPRPPPRRPRRP